MKKLIKDAYSVIIEYSYAIAAVVLTLASIISYFTSLIYCVANAEWLAVMVLHIFLAPLGVVHGVFIWFGASWF